MAIARQEKDPDTDIKAVPGSSFFGIIYLMYNHKLSEALY